MCLAPKQYLFFLLSSFFASPTIRSAVIVRMLHKKKNKKKEISFQTYSGGPLLPVATTGRYVGRFLDGYLYCFVFIISGLILPNATGWLTISRLDGGDYY